MTTPAFDGGDDARRRRTPADDEKTMIDLLSFDEQRAPTNKKNN